MSEFNNPLANAGNFWSNSGLSGFLNSINCCGSRNERPGKQDDDLFATTVYSDPNAQLWVPDDFYDVPDRAPPLERSRGSTQSSHRDRRDSYHNPSTGKGGSLSAREDNDGDDDDARSQSSTRSRKKIKKTKDGKSKGLVDVWILLEILDRRLEIVELDRIFKLEVHRMLFTDSASVALDNVAAAAHRRGDIAASAFGMSERIVFIHSFQVLLSFHEMGIISVFHHRFRTTDQVLRNLGPFIPKDFPIFQ